MSRKTNEKFLDAYLILDSALNERFGMKTGGATEYINRLSAAKLAPGRDEALPRLMKYRGIRNKFAHEPGELKNSKEISSDDISWVKKFTVFVNKYKDPLSLLKNNGGRNRGGAAKAIIVMLLLAVVAAGVLFLLKYFGII